MTLFFVRHAESVSNAKLKDELGDGDQLSPHGKKQAERLVRHLKEHNYDYIYVSPSLRTIQTLAPYLREVKRRAVVLPMATEIKDVHRILEERVKPRTKPIQRHGDFEDVLQFDPQFPAVVVKGEHHLDGVARSHELASFLRRQADGEKTVLLVSHGIIGRFLIAKLTGDLSVHLNHPRNARLWSVRGERGAFRIKIRNGKSL